MEKVIDHEWSDEDIEEVRAVKGDGRGLIEIYPKCGVQYIALNIDDLMNIAEALGYTLNEMEDE